MKNSFLTNSNLLFKVLEQVFLQAIKKRLISASSKTQIKKYNLDDFLEIINEEETFEQPEDEPSDPKRADIIQSDDDDELRQGAQEADGDEDLEEDDYGNRLPTLQELIFR